MARPMWKGSISFGLVNIPVSLYNGEQTTEIHFNLLDRRDQAHIRYKKINEVTGKEVKADDIVKGFKLENDQYVLLEDSDFEHIATEASKTVEITDFVKREEIDPRYFDRPYYLVPEKSGEKGYVLLRETLKKQERVGIAKVVLRTRENLAAVWPEGDALLMILLRFQKDLKDAEDVGLSPTLLAKQKVTERELTIAAQLVEAMSTEWHPENYENKYEETFEKFVARKVKEGENFKAAEVQEEKPSAPADIMELLRKSLAAKDAKPKAKAKITHKKTSAKKS